jgi:hypothetical protein
VPDSVWVTAGTSRLDRNTSGRRGLAWFSPVDGEPAAGKRQSHDLNQWQRGCAGFSLGDGGHIAARLEDKLERTAGAARAGRVQSSGRWACSRD